MRGPCGSGYKLWRGGAWAGAACGLAAGPARARGPACCCALAGQAGCWLGREAEQAWATARLPPFSSFSVFLFFFI